MDQIRFDWGCAPDPAGDLMALPQALKLNLGEGKGREGLRERRTGKGRKWGMEGAGKGGK